MKLGWFEALGKRLLGQHDATKDSPIPAIKEARNRGNGAVVAVITSAENEALLQEQAESMRGFRTNRGQS